MPQKNEHIYRIRETANIQQICIGVPTGFEYERLEWAIATAQNSPHLWQHKYKGTPLQILIEHAKKSM